jgi:hypothetical protein
MRLRSIAFTLAAGLWLVPAPAALAQPGYLGFGSPYLGYGGYSGFGPYGYGLGYGYGAPPGQFYGSGTYGPRLSWGAAGYYNSAYSIYGAPGAPLFSGAYTPLGAGFGYPGYASPAVWTPGFRSRYGYGVGYPGPFPGTYYGPGGYGPGYGYPAYGVYSSGYAGTSPGTYGYAATSPFMGLPRPNAGLVRVPR